MKNLPKSIRKYILIGARILTSNFKDIGETSAKEKYWLLSQNYLQDRFISIYYTAFYYTATEDGNWQSFFHGYLFEFPHHSIIL